MNRLNPLNPITERVFDNTLMIKRVVLMLTLSIGCSHAGESMFSGQFSGWTGYNQEWQAGMRYIPELRLSHPLFGGKGDAEISLNSFTWAPLDSPSDVTENAELKLYRSWIRYSTAQFGLRLGLQEMNFGPAKILRSLSWFNQVDMRDPLRLSDGVYALLGRYYFLNNANIWAWGLCGNDELKGLEMFQTDKDRVEYGGRYQFPLFKGELAVSLDRRYVDVANWEGKMSVPMSDGSENRCAIDGSWDIGPGVWFEVSANEMRIDEEESVNREFFTVGTDYTFDIGPGIHVLCEQFVSSSRLQMDESSRFSALLIDFSVTMLDRLNLIGYYDWEENQVYAYVGLQRTYDNWQINLMGFSSMASSVGSFGGEGVRLMVAYDH